MYCNRVAWTPDIEQTSYGHHMIDGQQEPGEAEREPQDTAKGGKSGSQVLKMPHLMEPSHLIRGIYTEVRCLSSIDNKLKALHS